MNKNIIKYIITLYFMISGELISQVPSIRLVYEPDFYTSFQPGNVWSSVNVVDVIGLISNKVNGVYNQVGINVNNSGNLIVYIGRDGIDFGLATSGLGGYLDGVAYAEVYRNYFGTFPEFQGTNATAERISNGISGTIIHEVGHLLNLHHAYMFDSFVATYPNALDGNYQPRPPHPFKNENLGFLPLGCKDDPYAYCHIMATDEFITRENRATQVRSWGINEFQIVDFAVSRGCNLSRSITWGIPGKTFSQQNNINIFSFTLFLPTGCIYNLNGHWIRGTGNINKYSTFSQENITVSGNDRISGLSSVFSPEFINFYDEGGTIITLSPGIYSASGNYFVKQGVTLNLQYGTTLNFSSSNSKISVYGQLLSCGVTFSSSGPWFGIGFYNSNSSNSLSGCNINNATYGIYSENSSSITLSNCNFFNSVGSYEAIGLNNTVIQAYGCKIGTGSLNLTTGINANNSSNVLVRNSKFYYASGGCVFGDYNTWMNFGTSGSYGNNSFMNSNYHVNIWWNVNTNKIPAIGNYWAVGSLVNLNKVDCSNPLSSDPNPNLSRKKLPLYENQSNILMEKSSLSQSSLEDDYSLTEANNLFSIGKYSEALNLYEQIIDKNSDKSISKQAIIGVERCLEALGREKEILTRYENLKAAKNNNWGNLIEFRKLKYTQDKISVNEKANILEKIIADNDDESLVKLSLSELIRMNQKNPVIASVYLDKLSKLYPNDLITRVNRYELSSGESEKYSEKPDQKSKKEINLETELSNYPNPFNPSTTINYSIPKDGYITIKVYDAIGREVKTLISENKTAGSYSAIFNASNLSSGIYFYRMNFQPDDRTKTTNINKSMRLVK